MADPFDERFQKTVRMIFSDNAGERAAAVEAINVYAGRAKLAPSDFTLVHSRELQGQLYQRSRQLQIEKEELAERLAFIEARAEEQVSIADVLRWAASRTARIDRWPEFRDLARRRLLKGAWDERNAYKMIAGRLGVTADDVRAWREGAREIPDAVLRDLGSRDVQLGAKPRSGVKSATKPPARGKVSFAGAELPQAEYNILRALLSSGAGGLNGARLAAATGVHPKSVTRALSTLKGMGFAEQVHDKPGFWRPTQRASSADSGQAREVA